MQPVPPVRGPDGAALVHRLMVLAHGMRRLVGASAAWDERNGLDPLVARVVAACEPSPCTAADVARSLLCRFQTASTALVRLQREGIVRRAPMTDRRCRGYRLTRRGLADVREADGWLEVVSRDVSHMARPEEIRPFTATLARFELAVREELFEQELHGIAGVPPW